MPFTDEIWMLLWLVVFFGTLAAIFVAANIFVIVRDFFSRKKNNRRKRD